MEANKNRDQEREHMIEELLTAALKSESGKGLSYGFAEMVTRKAFVQKSKGFAIKTYAIVFVISMIIAALSLILLSFIDPVLTYSLFSVLRSARYIIGFIILSFFLIEYIDHIWIRKHL